MSRTSTKSWQIKFFTKKGAFQILYVILITSHIIVKNPRDLYNKVLNSDWYLHEEFHRIILLVLQKNPHTTRIFYISTMTRLHITLINTTIRDFFLLGKHISHLIFQAPCLLLWFASLLLFVAENFFLDALKKAQESLTFRNHFRAFL